MLSPDLRSGRHVRRLSRAASLPGLLVGGVFPAETAILPVLYPARLFLFVLGRRVVPPLALAAL